jgi:hypothetical protein
MSGFLPCAAGGLVVWFCVAGVFAIPPIIAGPKRYQILGIIALIIAATAAAADYKAGKGSYDKIKEIHQQQIEESRP